MELKKNPQLEIGRNSSIYFAIGLNIALFISWQSLEYKTYIKKEIDVGFVKIEHELIEEIPLVKIIRELPPPPVSIEVSENIKVVEDLIDVEESIIESTETNQETKIHKYDYDPDSTLDVSDINVEYLDEDVEIPFMVIEEAPVFPGCEGGTKKDIRACFQKKLAAHIAKHFVYPQTALDLRIQGRVSVLFVIDLKGYVTDVKSRGPDRVLEEEAERIISLLPRMTPGKQRDKPVKVSYSIPIFFKYESR